MSFQVTGLPEADAVLDEHPFAVVVVMLLDQQYEMEHAFRGPWKIKSRPGPIDPDVIAIHTYDWLGLGPHDELRIERAERTNTENLRASLDGLAALAERHAPQR